MKRLIIITLLAVCTITYMGGAVNPSELAVAVMTGDIVRLHVIANSDTADDQAAKLKVRDAVLELCSNSMSGASTAQIAYDTLSALLPDIEKTAETVLRHEGMAHEVQAYMGEFSFPERIYDGEVVPAGVYDALRIVIGEGTGQNWWCVMYPPLCLVDKDADKTRIKPVKGVQFQSKVADLFKKLKSGK